MLTALLALLKINPEMQTALTEACDCNFSVQLIVAPTSSSAPDCHKARGQAACVIPRGFPLEPALGLALTGDTRVTEITWAINYPDSAFSPGSTGCVIQEDVDLLQKAGFSCHTVGPQPVTPTQDPPVPHKKSNAALIALCCVGAACVVALIAGVALVSTRRSTLGQDLLLSTQESQYTESPLLYKA